MNHWRLVAAMLLLGYAPGCGDEPPAPQTSPARPATAVAKRVRRGAAPAGVSSKASEADAPPPAHAASLTVRVTSAAKDAPVAGASVRVEDADCEAWTATTGDEGTALFAALPPGATEVRVEARDALPATKSIALAADERAEVAISLARAAVLEGVLVDQVDGAPLADADVEVVAVDASGRGERVLGEARTDEKGRYRIESLPAEARVTLRVRTEGRHARVVEVVLGHEANSRIEVPIEKGGRVSGVVRDPDGKGLVRADIALREPSAPPKAPPLYVVESGTNGAYAFDDVPFGIEFEVVARATGWANSEPSAPFRLAAESASATLDLSVRRPAALRIAVAVEEGADEPPLVMVRLDDESAATALSTGPGTAFREGLTPGTHRVRVAAENFLPEERRVELAEGARETIEVRLTRGLTISGTVVGARGEPIHGAVVVACDPDLPGDARSLRQDRAQTAKAESGAFRIGGLLPRRYRVRAYVPNGSESAEVEIVPPSDGTVFLVAAGTRVALRVVLPTEHTRPARLDVSASVGQPMPNAAAEFDKDLRPEPLAWSERSTIECEVPPGAAWLRVSASGFAPAVVPISPQPGRLVDCGEVRLEPALRIKGRVVDENGLGVAWARVMNTSNDDTSVRSLDDGAFEVGGLGAGAAILRAEVGKRFGSVVAEAGATNIAVVVRPSGTLNGRVLDADGFPVRDAIVAIRHGFADATLDRGREAVARTGADGTFTATVAAGRVRATAGGVWVETDVPEGGAAEASLTQR